MEREVTTWDDEAAEGHANGLLLDAELDGIDVILHPLILGHRLDITMSPIVQSYCRGLLDVNAWTIRYDGRGPSEEADRRLSHEFGHVGALCAGVQPVHCEACVDRVAMALWMPRTAVERIVRRVGLNVPALLSAMPGIPADWVLRRVAWVTRRPLAIHTGRVTREAWAPDGLLSLPGHIERTAVAGVRAYGKPMRVRYGGTAWPCEAVGAGAVVILGECGEAR